MTAQANSGGRGYIERHILADLAVAGLLLEYIDKVTQSTHLCGADRRFELTVINTGAVHTQRMPWTRRPSLSNLPRVGTAGLQQPDQHLDGRVRDLATMPHYGGALLVGGLPAQAITHLVDPTTGDPNVELEIFARMPHGY